MGLIRGIPEAPIIVSVKFSQPINPEEFSMKFRYEDTDAYSHVIGAQDLSENNTLASIPFQLDPMFRGDKITLMSREVGEIVIYIESVKMEEVGFTEEFTPFAFQNTQLDIL